MAESKPKSNENGQEEDDNWSNELEAEFDGHRNRKKVILLNLPDGLTANGLEHMCQAYGTVEKLIRPMDKPYAFVTFQEPPYVPTIYP